ncbi:FlxA-like family protein [Candidatus Pristimantibacillus sp. PTI5]|uniref:FlxA-like family protein n=1 Tax=Candidatus Pristimantibacillus sp. PTI5 TaxID=3400422 RepID=UPI003B0189BA
MNLSSLTSSSPSAYSSYQSASPGTSSLEKQLSGLQAELKKVNDSKEDQAAKEKKAQVIQHQIQQLQQEIAKQKTKASAAGGESRSEAQAGSQISKPAAGPAANSDRTFDMRV